MRVRGMSEKNIGRRKRRWRRKKREMTPSSDILQLKATNDDFWVNHKLKLHTGSSISDDRSHSRETLLQSLLTIMQTEVIKEM